MEEVEEVEEEEEEKREDQAIKVPTAPAVKSPCPPHLRGPPHREQERSSVPLLISSIFPFLSIVRPPIAFASSFVVMLFGSCGKGRKENREKREEREKREKREEREKKRNQNLGKRRREEKKRPANWEKQLRQFGEIPFRLVSKQLLCTLISL